MASRLSKFLSQCLDVHIDCPALTLIVKAPHLVHDLIPRQHDSLVDDKVFEKFKFFVGELTQVSIHVNGVFIVIHQNIPVGDL